MSEAEIEPRIIKKYPNRRLYDTEKSKYVTLQQIRDLVLEEVPFIVIDQKTDEDITRSILLQIIFEQESETNPLFSNDNLERFISPTAISGGRRCRPGSSERRITGDPRTEVRA